MNFHQYKMKYLVTAYDHVLSQTMAEGRNMSPPLLFIMGTGRTGTTLMSCILNNHEQLCVPSECSLIPMMIKYWRRKRLDSWEKKVEFVINLLMNSNAWKINNSIIKSKLLTLDKDKRNPACIIDLIYHEDVNK